jgi:hypothetical protein
MREHFCPRSFIDTAAPLIRTILAKCDKPRPRSRSPLRVRRAAELWLNVNYSYSLLLIDFINTIHGVFSGPQRTLIASERTADF